jgi:HK97 family phage major capsid protein
MDELLGDNFDAIGADAEELRNLNTTGGGAGGFTVPALFHREMSEAMQAYQGVVEAGAELLPTESGQDLPIPSNDDTANVATIVAETVAMGASTMAFAQTVLSTFMYTTGIIPVSLQLMQDSAFPLDGWIKKKLAERMGRGTNIHFTTGSGVGQPRGIITALGTGAGIGVNTAAKNAITADEILNLQHSVDPAYRKNGKYGFSDGILNRIRLLKDLQGRYLLNDATQGAPATIFGKGYTIFTEMGETITPSTTLGMFGDFSHYKVRPVGQLILFRFEELYMPNLQKAFVGFQRFGGNFINPGNWPVKGLRTIA